MKTHLSLPRICITATGESPGDLLECARRALQYSRFVELRLDWLPRPADALPQIQQLLAATNSPAQPRRAILQATCRRRENGGRFAGTVSEQLRLLEKAAMAGCQLLDLEIESAESAGQDAIAHLRRMAGLILSFHDFQKTPSIAPAARRLRGFPADYYKLVTTATRQSDNCAVLEFLSSATEAANGEGKWIAFCMGEAGIPSRVLALSRGSAFVYASYPPGPEEPAAPAAPGQLDWETLQSRYRAEKITTRTPLYGLLGNPVRHSIGFAIHNAAFRARGLDAIYLPLLAGDLQDFRKAAQRYPLAGFSVTIPHKEAVLRFVDRMDRITQAVGAVNTVRVRRGRWEGINTDVEGIQIPLQKALRLSAKKFLTAGFRAVIVGNGGAARAAVIALRSLRCRKIAVTGRNPAKVRRFAREMGVDSMPLANLGTERFDLLVHATPAGLWPHAEQCFLLPEQIGADTVFDLIYNPPATRLLQIARASGCRTISGLEMFLAQAARQFEFWTGQQAPARLMRRVALQELGRLRNDTTTTEAGAA